MTTTMELYNNCSVFRTLACAVLFCLLAAAQAQAGVSRQQRLRLQQQQLQSNGYAAAGYRPSRQFRLPSNNLDKLAEPTAVYGPPAASADAGASQPAPQQLYRPPAVKPARLTEAQEDLDDAAEEVEQQSKMATAPAATAATAATALTPATSVPVPIAYYPAAAVGFVQPATFAKLVTLPYGAAPQQYYAAYNAPLLG